MTRRLQPDARALHIDRHDPLDNNQTRGHARADRSAAAFEECTGRLGVQFSRAGSSGEQSPHSATPPRTSRPGLARTAEQRPCRRLIQRGQRQRPPEHLTRALSLPVARQPRLDRLARGRGPFGPAAHPAARQVDRPGHAQRRDPIPPVEGVPFEHAGREGETAGAATGSSAAIDARLDRHRRRPVAVAARTRSSSCAIREKLERLP